MLRIKQLRQEYHLSQRALAAKINVSQKAIDLWENGITEPKASIIARLADAFECTADYIMGREDDMGNVNVMRELSDGEKELLSCFSALDKRERAELMNYCRYLTTRRGL